MLASWLLPLLALQSATAIRLPPSLRGPFRRGLAEIPTACTDQCGPFSLFLQGSSCPVTECCSPAFEQGYFACFQCVGGADNATDYTSAQQYIDVVITACGIEGVTLPILSLPGQDPNRTLATALPADASAAPVFGPGSSDATTTASGGGASGTSGGATKQTSTPGAGVALRPHVTALLSIFGATIFFV